MRVALTNEEKDTVYTLVRHAHGDTARIESIIKEYTIDDGFVITFTVIVDSIQKVYQLGKSIFQ